MQAFEGSRAFEPPKRGGGSKKRDSPPNPAGLRACPAAHNGFVCCEVQENDILGHEQFSGGCLLVLPSLLPGRDPSRFQRSWNKSCRRIWRQARVQPHLFSCCLPENFYLSCSHFGCLHARGDRRISLPSSLAKKFRDFANESISELVKLWRISLEKLGTVYTGQECGGHRPRNCWAWCKREQNKTEWKGGCICVWAT